MLSTGSTFPPSFDSEPSAPSDVRAEQHAFDEAVAPVRGSRLRSMAHSPATYLLLGINIAAYVVMVLQGVDPLAPSPDALVYFGATDVAKILADHQWWRIVTAMFVHVGLIHLALNMWCLWNLGIIGEPLLGFFGTCSVYVLTGAAGNLLSVALSVYFQQAAVGAGASGAVFGIAGVLIVLFSNKRLAEPRPGFRGIPLQDLKAIRRSVIQFAALNLIIGLSTNVGPLMHGIHLDDIHIDNSAHIGGFVSGLAMAVPLVPQMTQGRSRYLQRQKLVFGASVLALSLFGYFLSQLR
jgi:rhomboid protease GluP